MHQIKNTSSYTGELLSKTFIKYLIPSLITMVALQLTDFFDSLIVSNLLGQNELAVVNMGTSVKCLMCATFMLFSIGGSILYADRMGDKKPDEAKCFFTLAIFSAFAISLFLAISGLSWLDRISEMICATDKLKDNFRGYLRILFLSMPLFVTMMTFTGFLPAAGYPKLATALNISANILNIVFDLIYILYYNQGVNGVAYGTITAFAVVIIIPVTMVVCKKLTLTFCHIKKIHFPDILKILRSGITPCISQIGFAVKVGFCCRMASEFGGADGVIAISICFQSLGIVSLFLGGIAESCIPLFSMLYGQKTYREVKFVFRKAMMFLMFFAVACTLVFELFPYMLTGLFHISDPATVKTSVTALRIFAICFLFRPGCIIFMNYANVLKRTLYAVYISLFDGFAGTVLICLALCPVVGLNGVFLTFPVNGFLLAGSIFVINYYLWKNSSRKLSGLLLLPEEEKDSSVFYTTFSNSARGISEAKKRLYTFLEQHNINTSRCNTLCLAVEEMAVYILHHNTVTEKIDLMLRLTSDAVTLDFRSIGNPFNPLCASEKDCPLNIKLLHGISQKIEYAYAMGLNTSRITIEREMRNA